VLPWALKILMISLVTVAVFIYRKPFTHLFSAVGYGVIGSREAAETHLARATSSATRNTVDAATLAVPGFAAYRVARWARRNPAQAASLTAQVATAGAAAGPAGAVGAAAGAGANADAASAEPGAADTGPDGSPSASGAGGTGASVAERGRSRTGSGANAGRTAPPLDLPSRTEDGPQRPPSGWARSGTNGSLTTPAQPRSSWSGTPSRPGSGAAAPGPAPRPSAAGPLAGHSGNGRSVPPQPVSRQAPPAAPRSAPPAPRGAPPARRNSPPPAPAPRQPRHTAPRHPAAPPPRAAAPGGQTASSPRRAPGPLAGSNENQSQEPAARGPFWLRPIRRRK